MAGPQEIKGLKRRKQDVWQGEKDNMWGRTQQNCTMYQPPPERRQTVGRQSPHNGDGENRKRRGENIRVTSVLPNLQIKATHAKVTGARERGN